MANEPIQEPVAPVKGQHIFRATVVEPMAIRWKQLVAASRHDEAQDLLVEIIGECTPMFLRLAQYEGFHHTVELESLVSAAQARVANWLVYWDPAKGKLFSWLSTSLEGGSLVLLEDGSTRRIDEIVQQRQQVNVMSWDEAANRFVAKPVVDWIVNVAPEPPLRRKIPSKGNPDDVWRTLSATRASHERGRCLILTGDHEVLTQRGWLEVDNLLPDDQVYFKDSLLTDHGKSAVVGMYLGDGCMITDDQWPNFGGSHGEKQFAYSDFICGKFRVPVKHGFQTRKLKGGGTRQYGVARFGIQLMRSWPGLQSDWMPHKKAVTDWVVDRLDPVALAYWYMDDGHLNHRVGKIKNSTYAISLHTECFSREDCDKLIQALWDKFGLKSEFVKRSWADYGFLVIKQPHVQQFLELVAPYVISSMRYKLPPDLKAVPYHDLDFIDERLAPCDFVVKPVYNCQAQNGIDFTKKYDITVADTRNFVADGIVVHNCSKHVFLGEVARASQYRNRYHATGDNLEKFVGAEDHGVIRHEASEAVRDMLHGLTCRWGDKQIMCCLRYHLECVVENPRGNKKHAIRGGAYAAGINPELSKFLYHWAIFALRDAMYDRLAMPYTEQDLFRLQHSFTYLPDLLNVITWKQFMQVIALLGGTRLRIPTVAQLERFKQEHLLFVDMNKSAGDPESAAQIARKYKMSVGSAEEAFVRMADETRGDRAGDFSLYEGGD